MRSPRLRAAAARIRIHNDQVTTPLIQTSPPGGGGSLPLGLGPGRTYEIPIAATAGRG